MHIPKRKKKHAHALLQTCTIRNKCTHALHYTSKQMCNIRMQSSMQFLNNKPCTFTPMQSSILFTISKLSTFPPLLYLHIKTHFMQHSHAYTKHQIQLILLCFRQVWKQVSCHSDKFMILQVIVGKLLISVSFIVTFIVTISNIILIFCRNWIYFTKSFQ